MEDRSSEKIVDAVVAGLVRLRKQQGLSHEDVAKATKLHRTAIGKIESRVHEPSFLNIVKICRALDCDLGALVVKAQKDK